MRYDDIVLDIVLDAAIAYCNDNGLVWKTDLDRADLKKFYQLRFVIEGFLGRGDFSASDFVSAVLEEYGRVND